MTQTPINSALAKVQEKAEAAQREAKALSAVAAHPAFADFPATLAFANNSGVTLVATVASRDEAADLFEALTARLPALPVVACRGTFASIKPACDYTARDGDILLDSEYAIPLAYDVSPYGGSGGTRETLRAWFETESDRVAVRIEVSPSPARFVLRRAVSWAMDQLPKGSPIEWIWAGLPNFNTRIAYASGSRDNPGNVSFAFDDSTDLKAWLAGSNPMNVRV